MDTHGSTAVTEHEHTNSVVEYEERFEKEELEQFVEEDRAAGRNIGKLLALVFLISFFLVTGVSLWMVNNIATSHDPQAGIGESAEVEHH